MSISEYSFPTRILFGAGARKKLGGILREQGFRRPLLVTDSGLAALPIPAEIAAILAGADAQTKIFSDLAGNPVESQVVQGVADYREHEADCIVALGGGAPLDVAKAIAVLVNHSGGLFEYEDRADAKPIDAVLPVIFAIPTTAGTGSEVGRSAVISEDDSHVKRIVFSPRLMPRVVFADPELLLGLPPSMTAATGMDALTHLIESRLARGHQPFCDGIAMEGLRLVAGSLRQCFEFARQGTGATEEHLNVRGMMLNASMMGAVAFQKGLGVTHSLAHSLSTVLDLHHGLANAIMLPFAMRFNAKTSAQELGLMGQVVGLNGGGQEVFLTWIEKLRAAIDIPAGLKSYNITPEQLDRLVRFAFADGCHQLNPRPCTAEDMRSLFEQALEA